MFWKLFLVSSLTHDLPVLAFSVLFCLVTFLFQFLPLHTSYSRTELLSSDFLQFSLPQTWDTYHSPPTPPLGRGYYLQCISLSNIPHEVCNLSYSICLFWCHEVLRILFSFNHFGPTSCFNYYFSIIQSKVRDHDDFIVLFSQKCFGNLEHFVPTNFMIVCYILSLFLK